MLVYSAIASLDGYVNDATGGFDWAVPGTELHQAVNDFERTVTTYLYGRRMYEIMRAWQTLDDEGDPVVHDFATIWRAADKVVYSTTLDAVTTPKTLLRRDFDDSEVADWKLDQVVSIGGPTLAAHALAAGLVDEVHLYLHPVAVGGGTPALPREHQTALKLLAHKVFDEGVVHLRYGVS